MIHDPNNFLTAGKPLETAHKVMIMVHGRGGTARDILSLSQYIDDQDFAFVAPEAARNTWYPYPFTRPLADNEPNLSSAMDVLSSMRARLQSDYNVNPSQLYWLGFSQGACLVSEFVAQNAQLYGGVFILSGGLVGPDTTPRDYAGSFSGTPVFLGCSDIDSHIPKQRVLDSSEVFERMGASVTTTIYPNLPHTINEDELKTVNQLIAGSR